MKQYKLARIVLNEILRTTLFYINYIINFKSIIGIFYPSGKSILPDLRRYSAFAVDNHSFMRCALHLRQP